MDVHSKTFKRRFKNDPYSIKDFLISLYVKKKNKQKKTWWCWWCQSGIKCWCLVSAVACGPAHHHQQPLVSASGSTVLNLLGKQFMLLHVSTNPSLNPCYLCPCWHVHTVALSASCALDKDLAFLPSSDDDTPQSSDYSFGQAETWDSGVKWLGLRWLDWTNR